jgi:hypothetical protein
LRRHEGQRLIPAGADEKLARRIFDVFWANVDAAYRYNPPDYAGEITLAVGDEARGKYHPLVAWRRCCQTVRVHEMSGKHLELLDPPCVGRLAELIRSRVDEVLKNLVDCDKRACEHRPTIGVHRGPRAHGSELVSPYPAMVLHSN